MSQTIETGDLLEEICFDSAMHVLRLLDWQEHSMIELGLKDRQLVDYRPLHKCAVKMFRSIYKPEKRGVRKDMINHAIDLAISEYCGAVH